MGVSEDFLNLLGVAYRSESTILITGHTGTGKTSLAQQIHLNSRRKRGPFIQVNLATLHEGTLESELFGHEKGAFTGADRKRMGRLELAQNGTVFLDEVGELSPRMQARLLEFMQSRTITPVGGNREMKLDVRVIAATHKDLSRAVARGEFREDLFHRLRVIAISLKSLSERTEDFDTIVHQCLFELSSHLGRSIKRISEEVALQLESYSWPGNIRELRNVLEYAVMASDGEEIQLTDLPSWFFPQMKSEVPQASFTEAPLGVAEVPLTLDYQSTLEFFEKEYFKRALSRNGGRITRTAHQIGLNKTTLTRRIRAYGIPVLSLQLDYGAKKEIPKKKKDF